MSTPTLERVARYPSRPATEPTGVPPPDTRTFNFAVPMAVLAAITTLCTALCLGNLFDGLSWWLVPTAGAIALAAAVGEVARRLRVPAALWPVVYVVAGWLYVIPVAAAHGSQIGAQISLAPSATTFSGLRMVADSAADDIRTLTVPVPERPGFLLLTVAGVYLVAALVDALAAGIRKPAAAGLPLLALLAVPAAITTRGVGLLAFTAACVSFLAMLLASGRRELMEWARLPDGGAAGIRRSTGSPGRRIAFVALALALAAPVVIPRFTGIARHHGGGGGGSASATVIEPVVTLNQQLHSDRTIPLLTVRTTSPEYLRLTALEHFDGQSFTLGSLSAGSNAKVSRGLPAPPGGISKSVQATINVLPVLHQHYLPIAYQPTKVTIAGDWRLAASNFTLFSSQTNTSGVHYTVISQVAVPTAEELRTQSVVASEVPSDVRPSLELPSDLPPAVKDLTERTVAAANASTEYDKVAAIQAFLRSGAFTYDLQGAPNGPDALAEFLLTDRRGYCEQFAGAMTVMLRQLGIPARVAVGFTPGQLEPDGSYLITNKDAHSWPEVWFPQAGWIRFEPTPRDPQTSPPDWTLAPPVADSPTPMPRASNNTQPKSTQSPQPQTSGQASAAPISGAGPGTGGGDGPWADLGWAGLGLLAFGLLLAPAAARRQRRAARLRPGPAAAGRRWAEVVDTAHDLGLEVPETLSPGRMVAYWSYADNGKQLIPQPTAEALAQVAHDEEIARYAAGVTRSGPPSQLVSTALRAWERSCSTATRWRAVLVPRSVLHGAAARLLRRVQPLDAGVRRLITWAGRIRIRQRAAPQSR